VKGNGLALIILFRHLLHALKEPLKIMSASLILLGELYPPTYSGMFIKMFFTEMYSLLVSYFTYH
jgi:hypothetical protein